jgi:hypothetical protein
MLSSWGRLAVTDFSNDGLLHPEEGGSTLFRNYLPEETILRHEVLVFVSTYYVGLTIKDIIRRLISEVKLFLL